MPAPKKAPVRAPERRRHGAGTGAREETATIRDYALLSDRQIVRSAREMILEVGVDGLTMRALSARLGVALGATYHHVPNKRQLLILVAHDLYGDVAIPERGTWDTRIKALMVGIAEVIGRYPGMGAFMSANADDSTPRALNQTVVGILRDAGFSSRGINAVLAALFFYVSGFSSGGFNSSASSSLQRVDVHRLFEDGLDVLIEGAKVSLDTSPRLRARSGRRLSSA